MTHSLCIYENVTCHVLVAIVLGGFCIPTRVPSDRAIRIVRASGKSHRLEFRIFLGVGVGVGVEF
jgi:hypothetical protein